jgi:hypothetical protein
LAVGLSPNRRATTKAESYSGKKELIELGVNGRTYGLAIGPNALLLDGLRQEFELTGSVSRKMAIFAMWLLREERSAGPYVLGIRRQRCSV